MACGCSKGNKYNESNPLVLGDPNEFAAVRVRSTVTLQGIRVGSTFWVTGSGVAGMVSAKFLVLV